MKNIGIKNPNPTASSFGTRSSLCAGRMARRAISPETNAPRRSSSPNLLAIATIVTISKIMIRTGSCVEVERCFCSVSMTFGGWGRDAMRAMSTAMTIKPTRSSVWIPALSVPSRMVMAKMGPNSPAAPAAVRNDPNFV